jgi:hypothetical protein
MKAILDSIGAIAQERTVAGPASPGALLRVSAIRGPSPIASGTVIRPVFTHRVHYGAPKAPGHRQFILAKEGWR